MLSTFGIFAYFCPFSSVTVISHGSHVIPQSPRSTYARSARLRAPNTKLAGHSTDRRTRPPPRAALSSCARWRFRRERPLKGRNATKCSAATDGRSAASNIMGSYDRTDHAPRRRIYAPRHHTATSSRPSCSTGRSEGARSGWHMRVASGVPGGQIGRTRASGCRRRGRRTCGRA